MQEQIHLAIEGVLAVGFVVAAVRAISNSMDAACLTARLEEMADAHATELAKQKEVEEKFRAEIRRVIARETSTERRNIAMWQRIQAARDLLKPNSIATVEKMGQILGNTYKGAKSDGITRQLTPRQLAERAPSPRNERAPDAPDFAKFMSDDADK